MLDNLTGHKDILKVMEYYYKCNEFYKIRREDINRIILISIKAATLRHLFIC
jgi:hypothetical protein